MLLDVKLGSNIFVLFRIMGLDDVDGEPYEIYSEQQPNFTGYKSKPLKSQPNCIVYLWEANMVAVVIQKTRTVISKRKLRQAKDGFPICFRGFPSFLGDFSAPLLRISHG